MESEEVEETADNPLYIHDDQTRPKSEFDEELKGELTAKSLKESVRKEDNHSYVSVEQSSNTVGFCKLFKWPKWLIGAFYFEVTFCSKIKEKEGWNERFQRKTSLAKFSDCAIIDGKLVVLLDQYNVKLIIFNMDGSLRRNIKLNRTPKPQQISVINDNLVAVSYNRQYVDVISIESKEIRYRVFTNGNTLGIANLNGHIYVVIDKKNIRVTDVTGEIIRPPFNCPSPSIRYITTDVDRLFLTDPENNTLYCCDLNGSVIWKFDDDETMKFPCGVTTDGKRNVYVTCQKSNNVLVISPDGKNHKEILTVNNGLQKPNGIYYDKSSDHLLVQNYENGDAFLYTITVTVLQSDVAPQGSN